MVAISSAPTSRQSDGRPLNVLLIEDNELDVLNVRRAFRRAGHHNEVVAVDSIREGLATLRGDEDAPGLARERRLVLLDLNLPGGSGHDFLRELRRDPDIRNTAVVVITGSNVDRDRFEAFDYNVAGYLVKPVDPDAFAMLVESLQRYWSVSELPPGTRQD